LVEIDHVHSSFLPFAHQTSAIVHDLRHFFVAQNTTEGKYLRHSGLGI